jgi:glycosyltransferase involved in cell wall biosynthesis
VDRPTRSIREREPARVSLIIPARDEEQRLAGTISRYAEALLEAYGPAFEIIVVSNGSRDRTAAVARASARVWPQVRLIEITALVGKGGAVLEGFRRAKGQRLVFADADGATAPESVVELADQLDHWDVVIGSRRLSGSVIDQHQPFARRLLGMIFSWTVRAVFGLPYPDTQCGAKALRPPAARRLSCLIQETRWTFDLDLLLTSQDLGLSMGQHPVRWADQPGSRLRILPTVRDVAPSLWRLARRHAKPRVPGIGWLRETDQRGDASHEQTIAHSGV